MLIGVGASTLVEGSTDPLWGIAMLPAWVFLAKFEGLYDTDQPRIWHLTTDEAPAIFHWVTLSVAGVSLAMALVLWALALSRWSRDRASTPG